MQQTIIGREDEKIILKELLKSTEPELLAICGRRRVAKHFSLSHFIKTISYSVSYSVGVDSIMEKQKSN